MLNYRQQWLNRLLERYERSFTSEAPVTPWRQYQRV